MPSEPSIIQFVCFETPLPKMAFVPVWTPFAKSYLAEGLTQIELFQRIGSSALGDAPDFISRNYWPEVAFRRVLDRGDIGEGGGWPVRATQGGSFSEGNCLGQSTNDETVIALLKQTGNASLVDIAALFENAALQSNPVAGLPARYKAVLEIATKSGNGLITAERLVRALAELADFQESQIAVYEGAVVLP